jgi:LacI family transcriptional regulator
MPNGARTGRSKRPTIEDVAARAGVSVGTASNVLNHPHKVAPATVAKVASVIAELGFSRNSIASALASGDTRTLALVVATLRNSLFVDIAQGAQRVARERGFALHLASADTDVDQQEHHLDLFDSARVSGLMLAPMQNSRPAIDRLRRHGRPIVVLNYDSGSSDVCTVLVDNEQAGYLAARHLIELGRTSIAFVAGMHEFQPVALRQRGVRRAVAQAGGAVRLSELSVKALDAEDGAVIGQQLVDLGRDRPDAVLAVTDLLAMVIISELIAARLNVPDDIAVMGCDHDSAAWGGAIPLTSVSMEGEEMGAEAVRLLLDEIEHGRDEHQHREVLLTPHLVVRESTAGRQGIPAADQTL